MKPELITPPAALAVSLDMAKLNLRITNSALDASITLWLRACTSQCEHEIGRSLINQGWRLTLDEFPDAFELSSPPTVRVDSIKYYDVNNVLQTLDPADYDLDPKQEPGYVVPAVGKAWPETFDRINAVMIGYTCGYGETDDLVPPGAQQYILARLSEQFDPATREFKETSQSRFVERLLDCLRTYN